MTEPRTLAGALTATRSIALPVSLPILILGIMGGPIDLVIGSILLIYSMTANNIIDYVTEHDRSTWQWLAGRCIVWIITPFLVIVALMHLQLGI